MTMPRITILTGLRCGQVDHTYYPILTMPMPTMPMLTGLRCGQVEHAYYPILNMPMPTMPILTMACGAGRWTILETGRQPSSCSTGWMAIAQRAPGEYIVSGLDRIRAAGLVSTWIVSGKGGGCEARPRLK